MLFYYHYYVLKTIDMKRCKIELFIEEYFNLGDDVTEKTKIVTDFGQLVNLLSIYESKKR